MACIAPWSHDEDAGGDPPDDQRPRMLPHQCEGSGRRGESKRILHVDIATTNVSSKISGIIRRWLNKEGGRSQNDETSQSGEQDDNGSDDGMSMMSIFMMTSRDYVGLEDFRIEDVYSLLTWADLVDLNDDSDIALANQWDMCNSVVFTWIINSLSPDLYAGAIYAKYAYELWNDPKETYDNVDGSVVFNLHKNINSLTQSGSSLAEYYNNLNSLWKQFDVMFLMGLDDNSMATISNILTTEPLPLVKAAFAIVSGKNSLNFKGTFFNGSVKFNINFQRYFNGKVDFVVGHTVGHFNETRALITKIRDLKLNDNITLYDVLVVLGYSVSLLSVHKLSRDNKMFTGFNKNNACKTVSNCSISTCFMSRTLWHQRLGHPADLALDVLKGSLNLDSQTTPKHLCDTCNKPKQTREPFPLSDHKSSKIGGGRRWEELGVQKTKVVTRCDGGCFMAKGFYLVTKMGDGAACGDVMEIAFCGWSFSSAVPGHMTYLAASLSPNSSSSCVMQGASYTQRRVSMEFHLARCSCWIQHKFLEFKTSKDRYRDNGMSDLIRGLITKVRENWMVLELMKCVPKDSPYITGDELGYPLGLFQD
nr:hypothetical protein [Tanacetum cinerariifolium]